MKFFFTLLMFLILTPIIAGAQHTVIKDISQTKKDTIEFVYQSNDKSFTLTNKGQIFLRLTIHIVDLLTQQVAKEQKADLEPDCNYVGYITDCYYNSSSACHGLFYLQVLDINGKQLLLKKVYVP